MLRPWIEPSSVAPPSPFAVLPESDFEPPALPREHPRWVKDAIGISHRARTMLAQLRPAVVRAFSFWDHQTRSIAIAGQSLAVDASGSYFLS